MKRLLIILLVVFSTLATYAQKQIAAQEIFQAINKKQLVQYDGVVVTGDLDFTELSNRKVKSQKGGWEEIKTVVEVPVVFRNCIFKGDVIAYKHLQDGKKARILNLDITNGGVTYSADFRENVVFENCTFENGSEFKYSTFSKVAHFIGSKFAEQANFKYAQFRQDALWAAVKFNEYANFKYAEFDNKANFEDARFFDYADFKYTEFDEKADFTKSRFRRHADFKYAEFKDRALFDKTDFEGSADFKYSNGKRFVSR